jgi:hypothetical protein
VDEQREAGPVRPLEVLEDQQQRTLPGGAAHGAQRGVEAGRCDGSREAGDLRVRTEPPLGERTVHPPERLDERPVRELRLLEARDVDAAPGAGRETLTRHAGGQLGHDGRLPGAGLAGHQDDPGLARGGLRRPRAQARELDVPADERRLPRHEPIVPGRRAGGNAVRGTPPPGYVLLTIRRPALRPCPGTQDGTHGPEGAEMHPELAQRLLEQQQRQQAAARTAAGTTAGTTGTTGRHRAPRVRRALARLLSRRGAAAAGDTSRT